MSAAPSIELARIMAPKLGSVDPSAYPDEEFDLYSIPAFDEGEPEVLSGSAIGSAKQIVQPGDVLLSRIVPHIRRAWIVGPERGRRIIASGEWIVFRGDDVDPRYLRHVLVCDTFHTEFMRTVSGVGGSLLRARPAYVAKIKIPLPPLPEQRRIAEILDKADALRAKRRAALTQLDTLTQSIFLDMFGDPATNPKGWPIRAVAEYVREFQGGKSIEADADEGAPARNRVLKVSAVTSSQFMPSESKPVPDTYVPPQEHFVRAGDLLFSRANTSELVGAVAYVYDTPANILLPDKLWRFVWHDYEHVEPLFIWALFRTPAVRYEIGRRATGTSGSMKNISQEKLLGISTIFPPVEVQRLFVQHFRSVDDLRERCQSSLAYGEELFASLQQRVFQGDL